MKRNRILALALAVCLCAALMTPAAAATTTFTDVNDHWAKTSIQAMTERGLFTGYGDGTFRPGVNVTRIEALALCARVTQPTDIRYQIAADQSDVLEEIFPNTDPDWWFRKEAATCLALGVESASNLAALYGSGAVTSPLNQPMTKAEFAMYLVRGMGLEDLARSLDANELPFNDAASIGALYRPYVKVLATYGVLTGDQDNNFNPDQDMTRAICATMLDRSIEHIVEGLKVNVELPQYTKYAWTSGTIQEVDVVDGQRVMTLKSEITGEEQVTLPASTVVYQYNKEAQFTALQTGAFAKVCYGTDGKTVEAVRVIPAGLVELVEGECGGQITTNSVIIDGLPYTINRFTQVSAGGKKGDRSIIDYAANYTDAEAGVNSSGEVLWLKLSGGTRLVEGILTDVTEETVGQAKRTSITVKGYNGVSTTYQVPESAAVIVNGDAARLLESQEGRRIALRVSDADLSEIKAVEVFINERYLQGILQGVNSKNSPVRVELRADGASRNTVYDVADDCAVTYRGEKTELAKLTANSFVTAKIEGGTVTALYAWQGYEDTEGVLTNITYGADSTVLEVTRTDNTVVRFTIPLERLGVVSFTTGGKDGDITQLNKGDQVIVTVLYNDVTQVDYTTRAANVNGTLDSITHRADGTAQLTVKFADGTTQTYTASAATAVRQGDTVANLSAVKAGSAVALVAEGDRAISIQITGTATNDTQLEGVIYSIDTVARIATVLVEENGETVMVKVHVPSTATIITTDSGPLRNISYLNEKDTIIAFGVRTGNTFEATSVVRR